jgi:hypothetical protein
MRRALTALFLFSLTFFTASCLDPGAGDEEGETIPSVDVSYLLYTYLEDYPKSLTCITDISYIPNTPEGEALANIWAKDLQKPLCYDTSILFDKDKMKETYCDLRVKSSGEVIYKNPLECSDTVPYPRQR